MRKWVHAKKQPSKLKDPMTQHVNLMQTSQDRCEGGMGRAGYKKEMLEERLRERSVCVCVTELCVEVCVNMLQCERVVCDKVVCAKGCV